MNTGPRSSRESGDLMTDSKFVLRSIYVSPIVDEQLSCRARLEGITRAQLLRDFIDDGLAKPARAVGHVFYPSGTGKHFREVNSPKLWQADKSNFDARREKISEMAYDEEILKMRGQMAIDSYQDRRSARQELDKLAWDEIGESPYGDDDGLADMRWDPDGS